jgi:hypothetical protein
MLGYLSGSWKPTTAQPHSPIGQFLQISSNGDGKT